MREEDLNMTMLSQIRTDALSARKSKDPNAVLLTTLIGEIETRTKALSPARDMTDDEVVTVVKKFIKNADDTLAVLRYGEHDASIEKTKRELGALSGYLPQQLTHDELVSFAREQVEAGKKLGEIMSALKNEHAGRYDGKVASGIVKALFEEPSTPSLS